MIFKIPDFIDYSKWCSELMKNVSEETSLFVFVVIVIVIAVAVAVVVVVVVVVIVLSRCSWLLCGGYLQRSVLFWRAELANLANWLYYLLLKCNIH
jgi:hypothetical protein